MANDDKDDLNFPPVQPFSTNIVSIAAGGITTSSFAAGAVNAAAIAADAITAAKIQDGALTAAKFGAAALAGQIIRSIQSGTITIPGNAASADATISAVTLAKSVVIFRGFSGSSGGAFNAQYPCYLTQPATTTVRAHHTSTDNTDSPTVSFTVVEFM